MKKNQFPKGWNEARVQSVLQHHENQTEEEEAAEIEAMFTGKGETLMVIPKRLVPKVRRLIHSHQSKSRPKLRKKIRRTV